MDAIHESGATPVPWRLRAARAEDAGRLAPVLRAADRAEISAVGGADPAEALALSLAGSVRAFAVETEDGLAALFGVGAFPVSPGGPRVGAPWLLGSDRLLALRRPFLRRSRAWVAELGRGFDLLANVVDARNRVHIRWLDWAGFTLIRRLEAFGPERRPFYEFIQLSNGGRHV